MQPCSATKSSYPEPKSKDEIHPGNDSSAPPSRMGVSSFLMENWRDIGGVSLGLNFYVHILQCRLHHIGSC
jgi:hypothetical protein